MFKRGVEQSEWVKGLLAAEEMRQEGYSVEQLSDFSLMEGAMEYFWRGFDDYIGYCEERGYE